MPHPHCRFNGFNRSGLRSGRAQSPSAPSRFTERQASRATPPASHLLEGDCEPHLSQLVRAPKELKSASRLAAEARTASHQPEHSAPPRCTDGVRMAYGLCAHGVRIVYVYCTDSVRILYGWCTHGVRSHLLATPKPPSSLGKARAILEGGHVLGFRYCGGAGMAKCQMGWSTLQPRDCWRPLKATGQEVASTVTGGAKGFAAKAITRPLPSSWVLLKHFLRHGAAISAPVVGRAIGNVDGRLVFAVIIADERFAAELRAELAEDRALRFNVGWIDPGDGRFAAQVFGAGVEEFGAPFEPCRGAPQGQILLDANQRGINLSEAGELLKL